MRRDAEKGTLTAKEIQVAKQLWDIYIQKKHYTQMSLATLQTEREIIQLFKWTYNMTNNTFWGVVEGIKILI